METPARASALALTVLLGAAAVPTLAQGPDAAALVEAQREAMKPLARMNGVWRGPASAMQPDGSFRTTTQTERIGAFLGETLKVIEGRGFDESGNVTFNAFGILSYNPATKSYSLRSYSGGRQGDFPFRPTTDGYEWEVPAGPGAVIRYTASLREGRLHEVGERLVAGRPPLRVFEMTLERLGDSDWPAAGAVQPR